MFSRDCFFDGNRSLCDYYHKNTSQTCLLASRIITKPFILVISWLSDDPAFEAQNPKDNCNATAGSPFLPLPLAELWIWDIVEKSWLFLSSEIRRLGKYFTPKLFFSMQFHILDGKKMLRVITSLSLVISMDKNTPKPLHFPILITSFKDLSVRNTLVLFCDPYVLITH